MQENIIALAKEFFVKLNINIESVNVVNKDKPNAFIIKIKTNESGLIIWSNGKNLDAIQNILKLIASKKLWEKIKLYIEVNDYIKTKDDRLFDFIKKEIDYLEKTWNKVKLPHYSSYERKKIHWFVHQIKNKWIYTKSTWEGKERRLYIYKESPKLTIDIDWNDI